MAQNSATSVSVDANANRRSINPNIYGVAYADAQDIATLHPSLNRWGGNSTTRYNWQIDAHSAAADWYFETYSDGAGAAGGSADAWVATTRSAHNGAEPMFTIPMIDYLAKLGPGRSTLAGFSVRKYGAQTGTDYWNSDAGNGISAATGQNITGNDPLDTGAANTTAIQQAWVQHFVSTFGAATTSTGVKYYILDNEPSIWHSTHRDVHPKPSTYQEMYDKIVAYATAIRAADPAAIIAGPEEWGWWAMYFSGLDQASGSGAANSDYNTHNHTYYYPWLLQQLQAYKQQHGTQLIDIFTVHAYNDGPDGGDDSAAGQQARNRATRILWDPNFQDPYWYGDIGINGRVINWIPTLRAMVNQYCPGLQIGCTEYNWGDEANLNGATTQADVLGIYGREGFDLATRWTVAKNSNTSPATYYVTSLASQIYRNYDGQNSLFGDTSVAASVANPDNLSAFAAVRSSDGAMTVMVINKQHGSTPVTVSLANFPTSGSAQAWQINSASQTTIAHLADVTVANNALSTTVPSQSITLFIIPGGSVIAPPVAPTGLAAAVGDRSVTLTWNAGGGATSYTVKRGTVSGGPYAPLGTVTNPSPTSYADSGLTNGTTYFYVVSATNQAGTSPDSAEIAATPVLPPAFTSTATAAPDPVTQGTSTTVTATVTATANTLANGTVQVVVVDPDGNTAASQAFAGQNLSAGQSAGFTLSFAPASYGTFVVEVGVFSATGQSWHWNDSAGTIQVNSSLAFSSSATATPSTVAPGASTAIAFTVTDTGTSGLANANVEMQVFNSTGTAVATQVWSGQNFTGGQSVPFSYTWAVPGSQATGTYTVMIGVFDASWSTDYHWNSNGASVIVTNKSIPVITWAAPAAITEGTALSSTQLDATANVPGTFVYSPAAGTVPGAGTHTLSVTFTPTNATSYASITANQTLTVLSANQVFLQRLYLRVLGRPADPDGLSSFLSAMSGGNTRSDIYGDLIGSTEFSAREIDPAIRLYQAALARSPDYAGLQNWSKALQAGALTLDAAADQFAASAEFAATYGTLDNTQFVQQLYRNVLGREADPTGLANWVGLLAGGASRGTVVVGFSESAEFTHKMSTQVEILRLFFLLQQRMPTPAELQAAIALLQGDGQTDTLFTQAYPSGMADTDYVQAAFRGFLRRDANAGELTAFAAGMTAGTATHGSLVDTVLGSAEFSASVGPVSRLYLAALRRIPDAAGLDNWVIDLRAGNSLQSAADYFAASLEFTLLYGSLSDSDYVSLLYQNVLGRAADPAGLSHWTGLLASGSTRGQVLLGFSESPEAIQLFGPTLRTFLHYFAFFGRAPTQAELDNGKNYLTGLIGQWRQTSLVDPGFSD